MRASRSLLARITSIRAGWTSWSKIVAMTDPSSAVVPAPAVARPFAGRRLIVQAGWEVLLAVAAIATVLALLVFNDRATLVNLLAQVAPLGLAGAAMALSLRTGTPNLAVGALAALAG